MDSWVTLKYEMTALGKTHELNDPGLDFENNLFKFISEFDELLFDYLIKLPTPEKFFGGFDFSYSEIKKKSQNYYEVELAISYEPGLSRRGIEKLAEQAKEYVKKLNCLFKLFEIDVEFKDNPEVDFEIFDEDEEDPFED